VGGEGRGLESEASFLCNVLTYLGSCAIAWNLRHGVLMVRHDGMLMLQLGTRRQMRVEALTQAVCDLALNFAEDGDQKKMSRPFGE
jgi:hypothetical protein